MGDEVFIKVAFYKHVMSFNKKYKLTLGLEGPFEFLEYVNMVVYQLALLASVDCIHNMFNISLLHKYINDSTHVLRVEDVEPKDNLAYEEYPIQILD